MSGVSENAPLYISSGRRECKIRRVSSHLVVARPARGVANHAAVDRDPERVAPYLEDAAHVPGGEASGVAFPRNEADVAAILQSAPAVLPIGAQSSLTGGATPTGGVVMSLSRMTAIDTGPLRAAREAGAATAVVDVEPGVTLAQLETVLAAEGAWYPPAPTYTGASIGGVIATNAAGAATFKYGPTRQWVEGLTVVLASGAVLDLARGAVVARGERDGAVAGTEGGDCFEVDDGGRRGRIDVPWYRWPPVAKVSAGFFAAPGMDLVDLFIGSEGTLGVVTRAAVRVLTRRPAIAMALVMCPTAAAGLRLVDALRRHSRNTWRAGDARGLDVSAIEHVDRRCLELLREDGVDRALDVAIPADTQMALLVTLELPPATDAATAFAEIGRAADVDAPATPLVQFCQQLAADDLLATAEIALPGDRRQASLLAFREAVPAAVNRRVAQAQRSIDPRIEKIAADVIVPVERLDALMAACEQEFRRRDLDGAVWGHISDGNLHPNVLPRSSRDLAEGKAAMLALGRVAMRLGGAPCAEHGVGRNPIKQQLMRELVGEAGVEAMRRIKQVLDPRRVLAPGVLGL